MSRSRQGHACLDEGSARPPRVSGLPRASAPLAISTVSNVRRAAPGIRSSRASRYCSRPLPTMRARRGPATRRLRWRSSTLTLCGRLRRDPAPRRAALHGWLLAEKFRRSVLGLGDLSRPHGADRLRRLRHGRRVPGPKLERGWWSPTSRSGPPGGRASGPALRPRAGSRGRGPRRPPLRRPRRRRRLRPRRAPPPRAARPRARGDGAGLPARGLGHRAARRVRSAVGVRPGWPTSREEAGNRVGRLRRWPSRRGTRRTRVSGRSRHTATPCITDTGRAGRSRPAVPGLACSRSLGRGFLVANRLARRVREQARRPSDPRALKHRPAHLAASLESEHVLVVVEAVRDEVDQPDPPPPWSSPTVSSTSPSRATPFRSRRRRRTRTGGNVHVKCVADRSARSRSRRCPSSTPVQRRSSGAITVPVGGEHRDAFRDASVLPRKAQTAPESSARSDAKGPEIA